MQIPFDPAKPEATLRERRLDFADAGKVFSDLTATVDDDRRQNPQPRYIMAGFLDGRLVVVVWPPAPTGRRIISMRHAHEREAQRWRPRMG
ncbi:MAG TPA: BrnT family toxin [Caulobacteraceae bacterium]